MYINHYANGLLCVSDGIDGLFNYFEYDSEMKYDETQMQADIEKYGLYTYEEWADVFSYEEFIAFCAGRRGADPYRFVRDLIFCS